MSAADAASLSFWESVADWGTWLVIIGVIGEGLEIALKVLEHKFTKNRCLKWCEHHKFWIDVVFAGLFWIMVVFGLLMEFRGSHKAQEITLRENSRLGQLAGEANERAGNAEKEAQQFRLKADQLEAQLRGINPSNVPLASVVAYVAIEYKTNNVETNEWDRVISLVRSNDLPWLRLSASLGDSIDLAASPSVSRLILHGGANGNPPDSLLYVRRFEWDATMREFEIEMADLVGQLHKHTNELKGDIAASINTFTIDNAPFLHKTEIVGGKLELFFNGTVRRKFLIPHQWLEAPFLEVSSTPNPFLQMRLGATNWSYIDVNGALQTVTNPLPTQKDVTVSNINFPNIFLRQ
jgi:hypothetical protein